MLRWGSQSNERFNTQISRQGPTFRPLWRAIGYYDDELMQDDILIDVIGNVYKETGELTEDGEPVCVKEDGYFVNVRIINDSQISSLFDEYVVAVEHQLRGWM